MKKQLWLTSLSTDSAIPKVIAAKLGPYGFDVAGSIWNDDIERMGWQESRDMLAAPSIAGWLIVAGPGDLEKPSIRYGLSLLALSIAATRPTLPRFILAPEGSIPSALNLPTPLADFIFLSINDPTICAKVVAKTSVPPPFIKRGYHLEITGDPQVGQWFELSPAEGEWKGALLGVCGGEINFQAVGASGTLPKDTVLNYPVQGMNISLGECDFSAWGVQNLIGSGVSYFVRVKGMPEKVMFGPFPESDDPELYTLKLM